MADARPAAGRPPPPEQHSFARSLVLHLAPGAALFLFVLLLAALGVPAILAFLVGIATVIVPLELGYLLRQGRSATGRWTLAGQIDLHGRLPARRVALYAVPLVVWFIVILFVSIALLDQWLADTLFAWYPESIREFAAFEEDEETTVGTWLLVVFFAFAFAINGFLGPVVEELYFRGHLLPRIDRYGRGAPVLNAVLFSVYHLWTPWQNPGRIVALLPWIFVVWRTRSLALSLAVHISVNTIFLLLVLTVFL